MDEEVQSRSRLFDPVRCVEKLADPWCEVVGKFLMGDHLRKDGDGAGCSEVGV